MSGSGHHLPAAGALQLQPGPAAARPGAGQREEARGVPLQLPHVPGHAHRHAPDPGQGAKSLQIFFASYKYFSPAQIFFTSCKYFYLYKYFYMYKYFSSGTKFFRQVCIFFRQLQILRCVQVAYHERIQAQCQEVAGSPYIVPSTSLTCTHMTKRRPHLRLAPVKVEALSILFIVNLYIYI